MRPLSGLLRILFLISVPWSLLGICILDFKNVRGYVCVPMNVGSRFLVRPRQSACLSSLDLVESSDRTLHFVRNCLGYNFPIFVARCSHLSLSTLKVVRASDRAAPWLALKLLIIHIFELSIVLVLITLYVVYGVVHTSRAFSKEELVNRDVLLWRPFINQKLLELLIGLLLDEILVVSDIFVLFII
jgi:hypothetical protein